MIKVKIKITAQQLFCAIFLVPYGSSVLFLLTSKTKQDSWLAVLIYILPGILLQIIYVKLWRKYPKDTIVTYLPKIFGRIIGYILSGIYIIYFTYIASRVLRDFAELVAIAVMPKMMLTVSSTVFILVIGYSTFLGIENLVRSANVIFIFLIALFIIEWVFLLTTPRTLKFYNLQPVLREGIIPVIKNSWSLIAVPWGETLPLTMLYPFVAEASKVKKSAIWAVICEGVLLSLNNIMFISVLGVEFAANSLFPILQTLRIMKIGEAFDRLDIFIVLILLVGGFVKIGFYMYAAMLGTSQLLKLNDTKYLAIPFSIATLILSLVIAKNYPQHIKIGLDYTVKYIHIPLAILIPIIALLINNIKKKLTRSSSSVAPIIALLIYNLNKKLIK